MSQRSRRSGKDLILAIRAINKNDSRKSPPMGKPQEEPENQEQQQVNQVDVAQGNLRPEQGACNSVEGERNSFLSHDKSQLSPDSASQSIGISQSGRPLNGVSLENIYHAENPAIEKIHRKHSVNLQASLKDLALMIEDDDESEEDKFRAAKDLASFSLDSEDFDFEKDAEQRNKNNDQAEGSVISAAIHFRDIRDRQKQIKFVSNQDYITDEEMRVKRHESAMQDEGYATWQMQRAQQNLILSQSL